MIEPVVRRPVSPLLAQFVDCLWIQRDYSQPHARERVLPTGTANLVFALESASQARSSLVGPRSTYIELDTSKPFSAIGVHFKPAGASPFFGVPTSDLQIRV
jgi:hypothetical protein